MVRRKSKNGQNVEGDVLANDNEIKNNAQENQEIEKKAEGSKGKKWPWRKKKVKGPRVEVGDEFLPTEQTEIKNFYSESESEPEISAPRNDTKTKPSRPIHHVIDLPSSDESESETDNHVTHVRHKSHDRKSLGARIAEPPRVSSRLHVLDILASDEETQLQDSRENTKSNAKHGQECPKIETGKYQHINNSKSDSESEDENRKRSQKKFKDNGCSDNKEETKKRGFSLFKQKDKPDKQADDESPDCLDSQNKDIISKTKADKKRKPEHAKRKDSHTQSSSENGSDCQKDGDENVKTSKTREKRKFSPFKRKSSAKLEQDASSSPTEDLKSETNGSKSNKASSGRKDSDSDKLKEKAKSKKNKSSKDSKDSKTNTKCKHIDVKESDDRTDKDSESDSHVGDIDIVTKKQNSKKSKNKEKDRKVNSEQGDIADDSASMRQKSATTPVSLFQAQAKVQGRESGSREGEDGSRAVRKPKKLPGHTVIDSDADSTSSKKSGVKSALAKMFTSKSRRDKVKEISLQPDSSPEDQCWTASSNQEPDKKNKKSYKSKKKSSKSDKKQHVSLGKQLTGKLDAQEYNQDHVVLGDNTVSAFEPTSSSEIRRKSRPSDGIPVVADAMFDGTEFTSDTD